MHPILRNVLAVIAGVIVGSAVNMGLITLGGSVIPPPAGVDPGDMESLKASMHLFEPRHFLFPFLAHALGTLAGALTAAMIAASQKMTFALVIGAFFMLGGIASAIMLPAPGWFIVLDLMLAYLPMACIAGWLAMRPPALSGDQNDGY